MMTFVYAYLEKCRPYVLSILRIVAALLFLQHGLSKFFGFPSAGPPLAGLIILAATIETAGGVLLLVGLFTRLAALIMSGEMAFAYFMVHAPKSFYPAVNGGM
jgi:putative oxidoreductase